MRRFSQEFLKNVFSEKSQFIEEQIDYFDNDQLISPIILLVDYLHLYNINSLFCLINIRSLCDMAKNSHDILMNFSASFELSMIYISIMQQKYFPV